MITGLVGCISTERYDPPHNECPGFDTKQSDGEAPLMQEIRGMRSTPSLPWFPGPLWLEMLALDRVLSMGPIELPAYVC